MPLPSVTVPPLPAASIADCIEVRSVAPDASPLGRSAPRAASAAAVASEAARSVFVRGMVRFSGGAGSRYGFGSLSDSRTW